MRHSGIVQATGTEALRVVARRPSNASSYPSRRARRIMTSSHVLHHRLGLLVVDDVGDRQDDGNVALVLPPVLQAARFASDFTGLVEDRNSALAAVLVDLALI